MKKILGVLLALCMLALSVGALAAEMPTTVVKIDLATVQSSDSNSDYEVNESGITLKKQNVTYELSGNGSEKNIYLDEIPNGTYYVRLNGASVRYVFCNGKSVIEAVNNTVNSMQYGYLNNASVIGKGTINAETIMPNGTIECPVLSITDTTVNLDWLVSQGKVSLAGSAKVTMTGDGESAPVQLGGVNNNVTLTLSDSAKLYIKHKTHISADPDLMVNGILLDHGATVTLKDNSYLEAYAGHSGAAIYSWSESNDCHVYVLDNAKLKAVSDGTAIEVDYLTVEEGTLEVVGGDGIAVWLDEDLSVLNKATVNVTSRLGAGLQVNGHIKISDSKVTAKCNNDNPYWYGINTYCGDEMIISDNSEIYITGYAGGLGLIECDLTISDSRLFMNDVFTGISVGSDPETPGEKRNITINNSRISISNDDEIFDGISTEYGRINLNGSTVNISSDSEVERGIYVYESGDIVLNNSYVNIMNISCAGVATVSGNVNVNDSVIQARKAASVSASAAYSRASARAASTIGLGSMQGTTVVKKSWVEAQENDPINKIENSVVFYGKNGTVVGNATVPGDNIIGKGTTMVIPAGATLEIPANSTLTIPERASLSNQGTIEVAGTFSVSNLGILGNNGTIKDGGTFVNDGTFNNKGEYQLTANASTETLPKTGDASMLMLWICLMLGSGTMLVVFLKKNAQVTR